MALQECNLLFKPKDPAGLRCTGRSNSIAFFFQWGLYAAVAQGVDNNDTLQFINIIPFQELWVPVAVVFGGAGIVIGVGGSVSAIRKFLQV